MPREVLNQLNPISVRRASKPGRYADGNGLYLVVSQSGARSWVWRGMVYGRRRELGIGGANTVDLKAAREVAWEWRRIARSGGDPEVVRDAERRGTLSFAEAATRVHREQIVTTARNAKHAAQWLSSLERYAFPIIGRTPVARVKQSDIHRILSPIWLEKQETARRIRQRLRTIMAWATTAGYFVGANPVDDIEKGLSKQRLRPRHFKAVPWTKVPEVYAAISGASGLGALALRFAILTAARSGEVRGARWSEIDLADAVWTVPAERMKAEREHRVPLTPHALQILEAARPLRDPTDLVFPGSRAGRPLSDMTLAAVLKRLRIDATVHGFRSSFRDFAEEAGSYSHAAKELSLAHRVGNAVQRAYLRADLFQERSRLMMDWAQFCRSALVHWEKSHG